MNSFEMESPGLVGTKTDTGTFENISRSRTARTVLQVALRRGSSLLVILAAWLVRIEYRLLERKIPADWDAALSFQLDRLTDIQERLAEYLGSERRRP